MTETLEGTRRAVHQAADALRAEADAYRDGEDRPVESFVAIMGTYAGLVALGSVAVRRRGLPAGFSWSDVALVSVATHKLSRLISKDPVTSPLRAPFTRFAGTTGPAELKEEVRGGTVRRPIGELLTCPFCVSQWVATGLVFGMVLAPRATRLTASVFTATAGSDFLQFARTAVQQRT